METQTQRAEGGNLRAFEEPPRQRVPFYPNPDDLANLDAAKRLANTNANHVLRSALKWYRWLLEQKSQGTTVQVVRDGKVSEILIL